MAFAIMLAIVIAFSIGRELILSKQSGWERLSKKYPCKAPFQGRYKGCYWAQFTTVAEKHKTVATIGRMKVLPIRLAFPPFWIGAASEGLYLKRNVWNFLHPPLRIPWDKIQGADEITYAQLAQNSSPVLAMMKPRATNPLLAVASMVGGPLLELKLSEPSISIAAQLGVFDEARRFLSTKLKLLQSQGV
jgi:hypothetical protein